MGLVKMAWDEVDFTGLVQPALLQVSGRYSYFRDVLQSKGRSFDCF